MQLCIVDGVLGSGKTLAMTLLGLYFQGLSNCSLYSNYGVTGAKSFSSFDDFLSIAKEDHSLLLLDEAHTDLDSRNFSSNSVKFFTHVIFYLRKMRCTLFMATPSIENLDSRVRGIANLYIHVTKNKTHFIYDFYDIQSDRYLKTYKIRQLDAFECATLAYDTYGMVSPVEYPEDKNKFNQFIANLKDVSDNYYRPKFVV